MSSLSLKLTLFSSFCDRAPITFINPLKDINIEKTKIKIDNETDTLEKELLIIDLEEQNYRKKNMELAAKDRMREIKLWSKLKTELDAAVKEINYQNLIISELNRKLGL